MLAALAMTAAAPVWAETPAPVAVSDTVVDTLSERLFPMLGALGRLPTATFDTRERRIAACGGVPACVIEATIWTDQDRAIVVASLSRNGVRPKSNADLSVAAGIDQELDALNVVLRVYGLGLPGRYPKIDGPIFATDTPSVSRALTLLGPAATLVLVGSGVAGTLDVSRLVEVEGRVRVSLGGHPDLYPEVAALMARGEIKPTPTLVFPLADAAAALEQVARSDEPCIIRSPLAI
jgi:hypothetical protein